MEAVELSKKNKYKLILMDIQLPKLNGVEVLKIIKSDKNNINNSSVIIASTAYALSGDQESFLKEGFDDYIPKPYNQTELIDKIDKYMQEE
jgi:CheY-like chemotaxis protein